MPSKAQAAFADVGDVSQPVHGGENHRAQRVQRRQNRLQSADVFLPTGWIPPRLLEIRSTFSVLRRRV